MSQPAYGRVALGSVLAYNAGFNTRRCVVALNVVETVDDRVVVRTVLISVSDKTGLEMLARGLIAAQPEVRFLSTGGTHAALVKLLGEDSERVTQVSDYTGQPEMQGGLVKTLDFKLYLGLLSESHNPDHAADLERAGAVPIDLVVVNLYPFRETLLRPNVTPELARTNIDIGGPCMLRAAAKNYLRVGVLSDPGDYESVLTEMRCNQGTLGLETRLMLMRKAFAQTAAYDLAISGFFAGVDEDAVRGVYRTLG